MSVRNPATRRIGRTAAYRCSQGIRCRTCPCVGCDTIGAEMTCVCGGSGQPPPTSTTGAETGPPATGMRVANRRPTVGGAAARLNPRRIQCNGSFKSCARPWKCFAGSQAVGAEDPAGRSGLCNRDWIREALTTPSADTPVTSSQPIGINGRRGSPGLAAEDASC